MSTLMSSKLTRWGVFHLLTSVSLLVMCIVMLVQDTDKYRHQLETEAIAVRDAIGSDSWSIVDKRAKSRHQSIYYDSGFFESLVNTFLGDPDDYISRNVKNTGSMQKRFVNNTQLLSYQIFFRLTILEFWIYLLAPFCICIVITGYYKWRTKHYQLGGSSTGIDRISMRIMWILFISFSIMLILPPIFGSVSAYAPLFIFITSSFVISNYVANFAKDF